MGRMEASFVLTPQRDYADRLVYATSNIPGAVMYMVMGAPYFTLIILHWWDPGPGPSASLPYAAVIMAIVGGLLFIKGFLLLFRRRRLVVDLREKSVVLLQSSLFRSRRFEYAYEQVRLCVHESILHTRGADLRGFTLTVDLPNGLFSLARKKDRAKIIEAARQVEADTGIPCQESGEKIDFGCQDEISSTD